MVNITFKIKLGHHGTQQPIVKSNYCCYYQQPHAPSECNVVKEPDARRQVLMTAGQCFNCLIKGHVVRGCRSAPQCQVCKKKYHPSICDPRSVDMRSSASLVELTNVTISTLNPLAPPYVSNSNISALCSTTMNSDLLQTAMAKCSYMTECARKVLKLDPDATLNCSIWFK